MDTPEDGAPRRGRQRLPAVLILGSPWLTALGAASLGLLPWMTRDAEQVGYCLGWFLAAAGAAVGGFLIDSWPIIKLAAGAVAGVFGAILYPVLYYLTLFGLMHFVLFLR